MPLIIKDENIIHLAYRLAVLKGEPVTEAVRIALEERLERQEASRELRPRRERLREIAHHCASLPIVRDRNEDKMLGYDERGLPDRR